MVQYFQYELNCMPCRLAVIWYFLLSRDSNTAIQFSMCACVCARQEKKSLHFSRALLRTFGFAKQFNGKVFEC